MGSNSNPREAPLDTVRHSWFSTLTGIRTGNLGIRQCRNRTHTPQFPVAVLVQASTWYAYKSRQTERSVEKYRTRESDSIMLYTCCIVWAALPTHVRILLILPEICQKQLFQHPDGDSHREPWNLTVCNTAFNPWGTSTGVKFPCGNWTDTLHFPVSVLVQTSTWYAYTSRQMEMSVKKHRTRKSDYTLLWTSCIVWAAPRTHVRLLLILPDTLPDTFGSAPWWGFKLGTVKYESRQHSILHWATCTVIKLIWYSTLPSSCPCASLNVVCL